MASVTVFRSEETFTQEEFRRWVENRPRADINHYELVHGRIVMTPPAGWTHGRLGSKIVWALTDHVEAEALGVVLDSSTGYDLPSGETLEPDVSFVSAERLAAGPTPTGNEFLRIVPDLVVEILSPGTERRDRTEKKDIYEQNGVREYWLVDPKRKSVTVFDRGEAVFDAGRELMQGVVESKVLPELHLKIEELFAI